MAMLPGATGIPGIAGSKEISEIGSESSMHEFYAVESSPPITLKPMTFSSNPP